MQWADRTCSEGAFEAEGSVLTSFTSFCSFCFCSLLIEMCRTGLADLAEYWQNNNNILARGFASSDLLDPWPVATADLQIPVYR